MKKYSSLNKNIALNYIMVKSSTISTTNSRIWVQTCAPWLDGFLPALHPDISEGRQRDAGVMQ